LDGTQMAIYTESFSPAFDDMTFAEAAQLCFTKFKILLLAVKEIGDNDDKDNDILINPRASYRISKRATGFFIAQNANMTKRLVFKDYKLLLVFQ